MNEQDKNTIDESVATDFKKVTIPNSKMNLDQEAIDLVRYDSIKMEAYAGPMTWKIHKKGHIPPIRNKIMAAWLKNENAVREYNNGNMSDMERLNLYDLQCKEILEVSLLGFDYKEASLNEDVGPVLLNQLAVEIKDFLAVQGGRAGERRYRAIMSTIGPQNSNISTDSMK